MKTPGLNCIRDNCTHGKPRKKTLYYISGILINKWFRKAFLIVKTMPGTDVNSDYVSLCGSINVWLKREQMNILKIRLKDILRTDMEIQEQQGDFEKHIHCYA